MSLFKKMIRLSLLMMPTFAFASEIFNTQVVNTQASNSQVLQLNEERARVFELTQVEWQNYQRAIEIYGKDYFGKYTPPEILGILAKSEADRKHFADIAARLEHDKVANELEFQRAFTNAARKFYANEPVIKPINTMAFTPVSNSLFSKAQNSKLSSGDHLAWFVDVNSYGSSNDMSALINKIKMVSGTVLDIYCMNAKTDQDIQVFAKKLNVPMDLVSTNQITLNRDHGQFAKTVGHGQLPTLVLVHGNTSSVREIGEL